jgi:hypothetical protein
MLSGAASIAEIARPPSCLPSCLPARLPACLVVACLVPCLQGVDAMRHASRAALRVLISDKKLLQYIAGQASPVGPPASKQASALAGWLVC